jgi:hypothetical protein
VAKIEKIIGKKVRISNEKTGAELNVWVVVVNALFECRTSGTWQVPGGALVNGACSLGGASSAGKVAGGVQESGSER